MQTYLNITQIIVSVVLIVLILLQSRSGGLTAGSQDQTTVFRTRRGLEKTIFQFTLLLAVVFVVVAIASVLVVRV